MRSIKITPNYSKRTFTIRITEPVSTPGEVYYAKYRTFPSTKDEFNMDLQNTDNDWYQFLYRTNLYYEIEFGYRKI
jgi:hypothetical protein